MYTNIHSSFYHNSFLKMFGISYAAASADDIAVVEG